MGGKQTDTPPASREQHAAVLAGDDAAASTAAERYEATVWKLNGGGFFGCMGAEDAAGKIIERHCRAVPGAVPMWGQRGEFVIQVEGIRALVEFGDWRAKPFRPGVQTWCRRLPGCRPQCRPALPWSM